MCNKIDSASDGTSILERIFKGVSVYYNYTGDVGCFELDDDPHGMDGWNWQVFSQNPIFPHASSKRFKNEKGKAFFFFSVFINFHLRA